MRQKARPISSMRSIGPMSLIRDQKHPRTIHFSNGPTARLTNAFSKKVENHEAMLAVYFFFYNFCRIHQTLRCTPAMQAGVTSKVWELSDMVGLLDKRAEKAA